MSPSPASTPAPISPDTEVVLLLCARFGGEKDAGIKPLTDAEYSTFARWLRGQDLRPADLLEAGAAARARLEGYTDLPAERVRALLNRGGRLAFELERLDGRRGIWILGRADPGYPARWKSRLGDGAPPLVYGVGHAKLIDQGGLGIVGSRDADDAACAFTQRVAQAAASEGMTVLSGGARGVDQAAIASALDANGRVLVVTAEGVARVSVKSNVRDHILEGRLTLISAVSPGLRFTTWNAMARNRLIYTLCDYVLAVSAEKGKGGTWTGATENLKKRWVPLFVRMGQDVPAGNDALLAEGAIGWSEGDLSDEGDGLRQILAQRAGTWGEAGNAQGELPFAGE